MNVVTLFNLLLQGALTYITGKAIVEGGGTAATPAVDVGTDAGKPVYAWLSFSETKPTS